MNSQFLSLENFFSFLPLLNLVNLVFRFFLVFLRNFYWLIVFLVLAKIYFNYRRAYLKKKEQEEKRIKDWSTFEIKITKDTEGGPKLMENFFNNLKTFSKGYLVFELVGIKKEVHFYLRFPREYQKILESLIYSIFPKVMIEKSEDYFSSLPPFLPNRQYDIWGTEFILEKNSVYPIKTYNFFSKEENQLDGVEPIANFSEIVSRLDEKEYYIIQFIFRPLNSEEEKKFVESGKSEEDIVLGKKAPEKKITTKDWAIAFFINLITGIYRPPVWPEEGEKKEPPPPSFSQQETANLIERKISKKCFETGIRVLYISPINIFNEINTLGFLSYFNQFDFKNLNSFKVNDLATTFFEGRFFVQRRTLLKKIEFYKKALKRDPTLEKIILNSEELATVCHFPSGKTKIPSISQILFKKGEPPPYLPT